MSTVTGEQFFLHHIRYPQVLNKYHQELSACYRQYIVGNPAFSLDGYERSDCFFGTDASFW